MVVSLTIPCCVCGRPVEVEFLDRNFAFAERLRTFCSDCIGKEPKKIEKIKITKGGTELYVGTGT